MSGESHRLQVTLMRSVAREKGLERRENVAKSEFMKRKELNVNFTECFAQSIEGLSDEQVEQFREAFTFMDKDSDGFISVKELGTILRVLGQNPTETEIQDMINVVDRDSNGVLDFGEFASLMVKYHGEEQEENELWMAFKVFDRDGTGLISATELKYALTNLGNAMTEDEVDYMFQHGQAILDTDGRLNYSTFLKHFLRRRQGATLLNLTKDQIDDSSKPPADNDASTSNPSPTRVSTRTGSTKNSSRKASKKSSDHVTHVDMNNVHNAKSPSSITEKFPSLTIKPSKAVASKSPSPAPISPNEIPPKSPLPRTSSFKGFKRLSFKRKSNKASKTTNGATLQT